MAESNKKSKVAEPLDSHWGMQPMGVQGACVICSFPSPQKGAAAFPSLRPLPRALKKGGLGVTMVMPKSKAFCLAQTQRRRMFVKPVTIQETLRKAEFDHVPHGKPQGRGISEFGQFPHDKSQGQFPGRVPV